MTIKGLTAAVFATLILAGCQTVQNNPKQTVGNLIGAGLGALAGSQIGGGKGKLAAVAVGALAGAWIGGGIGQSLDAVDRLAMDRATQNALENNRSGTASAWRNPDSGNSGNVMPLQAYRTARGMNCRGFESTVIIEGRAEIITGKACRQPSGVWKIAN